MNLSEYGYQLYMAKHYTLKLFQTMVHCTTNLYPFVWKEDYNKDDSPLRHTTNLGLF